MVKVRLRPIVGNINLPTVLKTAILPNDSAERLFIATQTGTIYYMGNGTVETLLDIRPRILQLGGSSGGYDERGLLGMAFHPEFRQNGLFYLHYSVAGTQGTGALSGSFRPDPCNPGSLNMRWTNRENQYDHIDTVEEWIYQQNSQPQKLRTLLNLRRPFMNHNGVNSLNFSPETGRLVLTTGDGGSGYDPFNLSQDDMEIAGKIIEIDVAKEVNIDAPPVVTRFDELPVPIQETLTVIAKGVRNIPGISYQPMGSQYIKYAGFVGQDLVEAIFSFADYISVPVTRLIQDASMDLSPDREGIINFGWRGWEGSFPTSVIRGCSGNPSLSEKTIAYYEEAVNTEASRIPPLTSYYHQEARPGKLGGTALTGVQPYRGGEIPDLTGSAVFIDLARKEGSPSPVRGGLAFARVRTDCKIDDYSVIEIDYDFGTRPAYFMSLGTNIDQSRLYLGVYSSIRVTDLNQGTVFEIIP